MFLILCHTKSGYCYLKFVFCLFVFLQIPYVAKAIQELKEHSVKVFMCIYKPYILVCMKNACVNLDWIKLSCNFPVRNMQQRGK